MTTANNDDKLPEKFEDWTPPWGDGEIDAEKAARLIFGLKKDKVALQTDKTSLSARLVETEKDRDAKQAKILEIERKDESETDRLKRENEELKAKAAAPAPGEDPKLENARLRLAIKHQLTEDQADRLRGKTPEELEADVPKLLASFGGTGKADEDDEDDTPRRAPRRRSPGDPDPGSPRESTVDDLLAAIPRSGF